MAPDMLYTHTHTLLYSNIMTLVVGVHYDEDVFGRLFSDCNITQIYK